MRNERPIICLTKPPKKAAVTTRGLAKKGSRHDTKTSREVHKKRRRVSKNKGNKVHILSTIIRDESTLVQSVMYNGKKALMKVMREHATQQNSAQEEFRLQNRAAKYGLAPSALSICLYIPGGDFVCIPFTDEHEDDEKEAAIIMHYAPGIEIDSYLTLNKTHVSEVAIAVHDALVRLSRQAEIHHLDIFDPVTSKPHNIFLHRKDSKSPLTVTFIDFGMAREHYGNLAEEYDLDELEEELHDFVDSLA